LTRNRAVDADPAWSPDGRRIGFASDRGNCDFCYALWLMNADGSGQRNLTRKPGQRLAGPRAFRPAWSPDAQTIAFVRDHDGPFAVHAINADGRGQRRLAPIATDPAWSSDGRKLAFASLIGGNAGIWIMNADGSQRRRLTRGVRSR
jgi:Tol biopolymer transport system component